MSAPGAPSGVLLMTYGSPATESEIPAYLRSIRRGSPAPADLLAEFTHRYQRIGFSPLVQISQAQGHALQELLDGRHGRGAYRVEVGMLHSEPTIANAVHRLVRAGSRGVVGITLAPQYSPIILAGYRRSLDEAVNSAAAETSAEVTATMAGPWHLEPGFVGALAQRVTEALAQLPAELRRSIPIIFTAHSLPRPVVERDPGYLDQLQETVAAVVEQCELPEARWQFAYQSAGHTPEEWLRPDVKELLPGLRSAGVRDVLVVPVQFVSDHLEILYDIDVAAVDEAASEGIVMHRIRLLNTSQLFIDALASVVRREQTAVAGSAAR